MKNYLTKNQKAYDSLVPHYRERRNSKSQFEAKPKELSEAITSYSSKSYPELNFLELGPGNGEIVAYFEKKGSKTTAIEIAPKMIALAKEIAPKTKFIQGDILTTKLPQKFDAIYAGAIIHLFPKCDALIVLKRIWEWLEINGILFINTTISNNSTEGFLKKEDSQIQIFRYRKKWQESEFIDALKECNFEIIDSVFTDETDRNKKWIGLICKKQQIANGTKKSI